MNQIIECIPNFSEGRNPLRIREITEAISGVQGVKLLDVSSGRATNRTVVTFAGAPKSVVEAAFRGIQKAAAIIDMTKHTGVHPRFGATDVCPLVPVANISMEETVAYARELAQRVGQELGIPVYCYEHAAFAEERRSLANCRWGGYEGLKKRMQSDKWKPDFCSSGWSDKIARTGAVAIGARNFLVAYNINLNTVSAHLANAIALDVRESGRIKRDSGSGEILLDTAGQPLRRNGTLKKTRAIGWFIEDFGIAQVSMNLTDLSVTPVHIAFQEVVKKAADRGVRVTGSELVGLIPLQSLLDAGKYFLHLQKRSAGVSNNELLKIAIRSLGLDEFQPFDPQQKVIEYLLDDNVGNRYTDKPLHEFASGVASENPVPGGGAVAAAVGALGSSLGGMVANLTAQKKEWQHKWQDFSSLAERAKQYQKALLECVNEDTEAFMNLYHAVGMPDTDNVEAGNRNQAVMTASKVAMEVPLKVMRHALKAMDVLHELALKGYPETISDTAIGAYCAKTAVESALLNVRINALHCADRQFVQQTLDDAQQFTSSAIQKQAEILEITESILNKKK